MFKVQRTVSAPLRSLTCLLGHSQCCGRSILLLACTRADPPPTELRTSGHVHVIALRSVLFRPLTPQLQVHESLRRLLRPRIAREAFRR